MVHCNMNRNRRNCHWLQWGERTCSQRDQGSVEVPSLNSDHYSQCISYNPVQASCILHSNQWIEFRVPVKVKWNRLFICEVETIWQAKKVQKSTRRSGLLCMPALSRSCEWHWRLEGTNSVWVHCPCSATPSNRCLWKGCTDASETWGVKFPGNTITI